MLDQATRRKMEKVERRYRGGQRRYLAVFGSSFGLLAIFAPLAYRHWSIGGGIDGFLLIQLVGSLLLGVGFALFQWRALLDEREYLRREYPFDYPQPSTAVPNEVATD